MANFQDVDLKEMQQVEGGDSVADTSGSGMGTVAVVAAVAISIAAPELSWLAFIL